MQYDVLSCVNERILKLEGDWFSRVGDVSPACNLQDNNSLAKYFVFTNHCPIIFARCLYDQIMQTLVSFIPSVSAAAHIITQMKMWGVNWGRGHLTPP